MLTSGCALNKLTSTYKNKLNHMLTSGWVNKLSTYGYIVLTIYYINYHYYYQNLHMYILFNYCYNIYTPV